MMRTRVAAAALTVTLSIATLGTSLASATTVSPIAGVAGVQVNTGLSTGVCLGLGTPGSATWDYVGAGSPTATPTSGLGVGVGSGFANFKEAAPAGTSTVLLPGPPPSLHSGDGTLIGC